MSADNPILEVRDLCAGYRLGPVIYDVSCTIGRGEVVALFGHNGAGKSTLLKSIFGLVRASQGAVLFQGKDMTGSSAAELTRAGVVLVPQEHGVFANLTIAENLRLGLLARTTPAGGSEALDRVSQYLPLLKERWNSKAGDLSGGQQQMVSLARALVTEPKLLMLDEPSTGLAPTLVQEVMTIIVRAQQASGLSVLLVEQNVRAALSVAHRVYLMKTGRIVRSAMPKDLADASTLWSLF